MPLRSLAVFLASSSGVDPALPELAFEVGRSLAERDIQVVYGAGGGGLMGRLADGALSAGGRVVGVIPHEMMRREWGRRDLTELHLVDSMHERKARMAELSDAFVALPGGLGTLEELFEAWTWMQLGLQHKPCGLLAVGSFFDPLLAFLDRASEEGFVSANHRALLKVANDPAVLLSKLASAVPPAAAPAASTEDRL